jgi:hypothetical protein
MNIEAKHIDLSVPVLREEVGNVIISFKIDGK